MVTVLYRCQKYAAISENIRLIGCVHSLWG